ncbi:MAG: hypothetical protein QW273_01545 [Candidatus Pacearchaeota archaeon]
MAAAQLSSFNYFLPIFSFLFVFIIIYAILQKSKILGDNSFISLFLSFIIASFFIVNAKVVEFVRFNATWFAVFLICIVFILIFLGFVGKEYLETLTKSKGFAYAFIFLLIAAFVVSAAKIFNFVFNWEKVSSWANTEWFGFILLLIIALIVSLVLSKK